MMVDRKCYDEEKQINPNDHYLEKGNLDEGDNFVVIDWDKDGAFL